jgi:hypothetical protein
MFVALAGIAAALWIVRAGLRHEERIQAMKAGGDGARLDAVTGEMSAEIARLRDRVAVLEKLATDDDRKLAEEINRLGRGDIAARG